MVYRVYVEKRPGLTAEADALASDIRTLLGISSLKGLRLLNRYDVENISPELFDHSVRTILSEPQLDLVTDTLPEGGHPLCRGVPPPASLTSGRILPPSASRSSPRGSAPWSAPPGSTTSPGT